MTEFTSIEGSSAIKEVAHDPATNMLKARFMSGKEYHYADCGPEHFKALTGEGSAGKYLNANIAGKFTARKMGA